MRRSHIVFSLALLAVFSSGFLLAPAALAKKSPAMTASPASSNAKTQIITDQKTSTVYILINGRKVVTIDAKGLHVKGNVDYTGIITDKG